MKKLCIYLVLLALCNSCKKDSFSGKSIASVNIVNASFDITAMYVYFTFTDSNYYLQQNPLYFTSNNVYSLPAGKSPVSLVSASDTTKPLFQTTIDFNSGGVYSLYISGFGGHVDTLLVNDVIPVYNDSVAGVRFINLSPGSQPVSVNLEGDSSHLEFGALGYRQITQFKSYPDNDNASRYNFEIRDQATGNLLTTCSWRCRLFKNTTLVICGSEDPNIGSPINVFPVNNF